MLAQRTISEFVKELASDSPAPGGGSVAALSGSLAAALAGMVGRLTVGKEKYKNSWGIMQEVRDAADALCGELLDLMEKDTKAFNSYMAAMKLPKDTNEAKAARKEAMQKAAKESTAVPLLTLARCLEAAKLGARAAEYGNTNALSDAATAVMLARAGGMAAMCNVLINLSGVEDVSFATQCRNQSETVMAELDSLAATVSKSVLASLSR